MNEKWLKRYMGLAIHVSTWSEDDRKQVGSVIVKDNRVISIGYNGFPTGVHHSKERFKREVKLDYFEHAERNAIYTAAQMGHPLKGCIMFSTFYPCPDCARGIIQSGITKLITFPIPQDSKWKNKMEISKTILKEADVEIFEMKNYEK